MSLLLADIEESVRIARIRGNEEDGWIEALTVFEHVPDLIRDVDNNCATQIAKDLPGLDRALRARDLDAWTNARAQVELDLCGIPPAPEFTEEALREAARRTVERERLTERMR
ncbi:MAG: hypothetical protein ACRECH_10660 [Nitrososphaerales archaeon]